MMPKSDHQCHAIGCVAPLPFGVLFCFAHDGAWRELPPKLVIALVNAHQQFYKVESGQLVRNVTPDRALNATIEASYSNALTDVVLELARLEGKPLPAMVRS